MVSGTTSICCLVNDGVIYIANIGDSRAVLGYINSNSNNNGGSGGGKITSKALSVDHKPQRPSERERLETTSAVLLTERAVRGFGDEEKVRIHKLMHTYRIIYMQM